MINEEELKLTLLRAYHNLIGCNNRKHTLTETQELIKAGKLDELTQEAMEHINQMVSKEYLKF